MELVGQEFFMMPTVNVTYTGRTQNRMERIFRSLCITFCALLPVTTGCTVRFGSNKTVCGNGVVEGDEECDCGTDPENLPVNCNSINGEGMCSYDCTWNTECGNGVVERDEECDCGLIPEMLPEGCDGINGSEEGHCTIDCRKISECVFDTLDICDPAIEEGCCPDVYGNEYYCESFFQLFGQDPLCVQSCSQTSECYYGMYCDDSVFSGVCLSAFCGSHTSNPDLNAKCSVPGGGDGWCLPMGPAEDEIGICLENGSGMHGSYCDFVPGSTPEISYQPRNMEWQRCYEGFCIENYGCIQFCNWKTVYYEAIEPCPEGYTCLSTSHFHFYNPDDSYSKEEWVGLRMGEVSQCVEKGAGPHESFTICDLLTGEVLPERDMNCSGLNESADDNYQCRPYLLLDFEPPWIPLGTPMGVCMDAGHFVKIPTWEECADLGDLCEEGSLCLPRHTTDSSSKMECMAFCNINDDDCDARSGFPSDSFCISISAWFRPDGEQGQTSDSSPSILGVCGCPAEGCTEGNGP